MAQPTRMFPIPTKPRGAGRYIQQRRDFQYINGAVAGKTRPILGPDIDLAEPARTALLERTDDPELFVIYSLGIPIAWYASNGWTIPAFPIQAPGYSLICKHQNIVREAVHA